MKDFRITQARTLLNVHSISPIRGFLPISIIVLGEQMNLAQQVQYNELDAPEFLISSPSRLIVRIPPSQVGKEFRSLRVFSTVNLTRTSALVTLNVGMPFQQTTGIDRLIQCWMMIFLSNQGSDIFDPSTGAGGRSIIGRNTDRTGKGIAADLALAIQNTQTELTRKQALTPSIPLSEKLLNSSLEALSFDSETATLAARVSLTNMLGNAAEVSVG